MTASRTDEMIAAFKASGAKLACLCSSDEVYAREAAAAAKALAAAGARALYLAGAGTRTRRNSASRHRSLINGGCDALAILAAMGELRPGDGLIAA